MWVPQLSPMMGIVVFTLTNLAFITVLLSVRPSFNVLPTSANAAKKTSKAFRSFS